MPDAVTWAIMVAFYAPFHYLGPLLVAFLTGSEQGAERTRLLRALALECTLSMVLAFVIAVLAAPHGLLAAMLVLGAAMLSPYAYLALRRWRRGIPWRSAG
jgi:O-antigen/teichoic acid export membrane protein